MKACNWFTLGLLALGSSASAYPPYMDVGTFANTSTEASCCQPLAFNEISDAFYAAALATSQVSGGPRPSRYLNRTGKANNLAIISPNGQRDYCDFLFFAGHGAKGVINVWNNEGTGWVDAQLGLDHFHYGGWTRWVYLDACEVLSGDPYTYEYWWFWDRAFNGAQLVLGYRSYSFFNVQHQKNTVRKFWLKWTGTAESNGVVSKTSPGISIYNAHVQSVAEGIYEASGRSLNVTPALVTSHFYAGYHNATYEQNNGARSEVNAADWVLYQEFKQYDPNPY